MNRLQHETSPYLRQHADNPVDWYPWGEEALARARAEDRPVLVSIGYSTCHWCHVMERESFEDEDIAAYMNMYFISIKVDREERPDLDHLFMEACEILTGRGGWPLHVFLTPDGRPFFAGTYFPPEPGLRHMSWSQALQYVVYNFHENRRAVERQADRIRSQLQGRIRVSAPVSAPAGILPEKVVEDILKKLDEEEGGFGQAPKFPNTMALTFLLNYSWYQDEEAIRRQVFFSLDKMIDGGIFDQLGGGLARYAVDRRWLVPHFEKMLYDNALLVRLLSGAFQLTGRVHYREAIVDTLSFLERELAAPAGGFFAALDADSEGEEGHFYVWQPSEIEAVLGADAEWFKAFYGVRSEGNWEGTNILWRPYPLAEFAASRGQDPGAFRSRLEEARRRLWEAREQRVHPGRDEQVITGWNALMATAYLHAYRALGDDRYQSAARNLLKFLTEADTDRLPHLWVAGKARQPAFLDDFAFLIEALLEAYAVTFDEHWLRQALKLTDRVITRFRDPEDGLFFFAPPGEEHLLRRKELADSDMPSGNAVMAANLQALGLLTGREDLRKMADGMLHIMTEALRTDPFPLASWASNLLAADQGWPEIAVLGPQARSIGQQVNRLFLPQRVLVAATEPSEEIPLLAGKEIKEETYIYLCRDYACQRPVKTIDELNEQLRSNF